MFVRPTQVTRDPVQSESTGLRLTFLTLLVVSLFVLMFARLWFLQVMAGERYAGLAEGNAVRTVNIEAPRGKILDRRGEAIVRNRYANVISVQPAEMGERQDEILADLADLLATDVATIEERIERSRVSPLRPKPVAVDVPGDIRDYIHENSATRYPGVYAETLPLREYPHGSLAAHVVGYLGEIGPAELAQPEFEGYRPGDLIGWAGVERTYESMLRGREGVRRFEVNARNRVLRTLEDQLPTPGADLVLTLDLQAQQLVEEALVRGLQVARTVDDQGEGPGRGGKFKAPAAAAVVLDPRNGDIVALASHPAFEPEAFVGGVSHEYWDYLQDPESAFPLLNRTIQSSYPPGSVFKIVSAAAALEDGYMSTGSMLPCPGRWEFGGNVFRNWKRTDSGRMDLSQALVDSCDTVFYEIARRMWLEEQDEAELTGEVPRERLTEQAQAWGYGRRLGIDLPGERTGVVPGRGWKRAYWERNRDNYCTQARHSEAGSYAHALYAELCEIGFRWRGGDAVNMSIGQGDLQTTPLQVAVSYAAIANGGIIYRPHIASEIHHRDGRVETIPAEEIGRLPVRKEFLDYIHNGLVGVTREGGTAGSVFGTFPVPVAGKTGTAEDKPRQPIAWFAAYAPAYDPRYVVVVMVEQGGSGSQTAAPIVRRILEGLLGLEQQEIRAGVPTD